MINTEEIINRYTGRTDLTPIHLLSDGRIVIGEEVDTENHLWYVIQNADALTVELARSVQVIEILKDPSSDISVISVEEVAPDHIVTRQAQLNDIS